MIRVSEQSTEHNTELETLLSKEAVERTQSLSQHALTEQFNRMRFTEVGNAEYLEAKYGDQIRYSPERNRWFVWDSRRWAEDTLDSIQKLARECLFARIREGVEKMKQGRATNGTKDLEWAVRSARRSTLINSVEIAKTKGDIPIRLSELDTDPWLLNCENGTIDLRTGELREHKQSDLITKLMPVEYDPEAKCPRWTQFLNEIMNGNRRLIAFLQRSVGYSLTGDVSEQCWWLLYGTGANGKSTFLEVIRAMIGDYSCVSDFSTFMLKSQGGVRNDIARLRGSRLVTAAEAEGESRLAEVLIKQLTGGDSITARFLYGEYFEFKPQFKLFLAANHKPRITGTDHAIWRRIRLVPFSITIPDEDQDKQLPDKLQEELPGILAWAIKGCLEWQQKGLKPPAEVQEATNEYRSEQDVLAEFLGECCTFGHTEEAEHAKLYRAYEEWAENHGERRESKAMFGRMLEEKGITKRRGPRGKTVRLGIGLKG